uniref:Uncharacterized protein n=1 Tax=Anguilla anguilla TaxID=7936 RepID=A0A0E9PIL6_ANGAN
MCGKGVLFSTEYFLKSLYNLVLAPQNTEALE